MSVNFKMVGRLQLPRETEKFKPYSERTSESGWTSKRLRLICVSGTNRHSLSLDSLVKVDGSSTIYIQREIPSSGRPTYESVKVPFKDRLQQTIIDSAAGFNKYVLDLNEPGLVAKLAKLNRQLEQNSGITDDQLKEVGLTDSSVVASSYKEALQKRKEFISSWDMIDALREVVNGEKYKDTTFIIRGHAEYSYNSDTDTIYESFVPEKITIASVNDVVESTAGYKIEFNKDSLEDSKITGYHFERNSNYNRNRDPESLKTIPVQVQITLPTVSENADVKEKKRCEAIRKKFKVDGDAWKEVGCEVEMINGSPRLRITYDMLDDDQKDNIDLGLTTLEDIQRELGGAVYGEHIKELRFIKYSYGYSTGPKDTEYVDSDMQIKKNTDASDDDLDFDLFD